MVALNLYGTEPYEREADRVKLAIVMLSGGSEEKLRELVGIAKKDYRDILAWAETGPLTQAQGEAEQAKARKLLERWGKK